MKKAKIIKNGNLNLENVEVDKIDFEKYYSDIENAIIVWSNDGTKTAGTLTRQIIKILNKKK